MWQLLKLANKARGLPEVAIVVRTLVGVVGGFLLMRVALNLTDPSRLSMVDYVGLALFAAVGGWLVALAVRGRP